MYQRILILLLVLVTGFSLNAQSTALKHAFAQLGQDYLEYNGNNYADDQWFLSQDKGYFFIQLDTDPIGLYAVLNKWSSASATLKAKYEWQNVRDDVYWCDYVDGITDYGSLNTCIKSGGGWIKYCDQFETGYGPVRLVVNADKEGYIVLLLTPDP